MSRWVCLVLLVCSACGSAPSLPLDEVLPDGRARAGKVTRDAELIGGPIAYARAGGVWKLYNNKARFLVQDVGTSVGLDLYGGNVIDMDIVRAGDDGRNGNDLFRETFPIVGLHIQEPKQVELVADGSDGKAAIVRFRGIDAASNILPLLDDIALDLGGEITTDYVLEPDVPYLKVVTTYRASNGQSIASLGLGDFLSFGSAVTLFTPENGYRGKANTVSFLAATGDGTSYGYVWPGGSLQLLLVDASGTAMIVDSPEVTPGGKVSLERYLVVGDGDVASVNGVMYGLRGTTTSQISGTVRDVTGAAVEGAYVTFFRAPFNDMSQAVDQARTHADGSYVADLPAGDYVAFATMEGRTRGPATPVTVSAMATLDLTAGGRGRALFDIGTLTSSGRSGLPAKISFISASVEQPDDRFGAMPTESERRSVTAVGWALADGKGEVFVKPGTYEVVVSRGPEYEIVRLADIVVPADGSVTVKADLERVVQTAGWIAADFHQHSQGSLDSPVPPRNRLIENLAEGVEFPVPTEHDNIVDLRPHIAALAAEAFVNSVPGDEVSLNGIGHFNAYPLSVDPADPFAKVGVKLWARRSVSEWVTELRAKEPEPIVVHVSHPRDSGLAGYFNYIHLDPTTGAGAQPLDGFDAMEVNKDLGKPEDFLAAADADMHKRAIMGKPEGIPQLRDYFTFLNLGRRLSALGNSDVHGRNGDCGYPRNMVLVDKDEPQSVTGADIVAAIAAQRVGVTGGLFVTGTMNMMQAYGQGAAASGSAGAATLGVKVQAPTWIEAKTIEIYENGRPIALVRTGPGLLEQVADGTPGAVYQMPLDAADRTSAVVRFDGNVTLHPTRDAWYFVLARGPGNLLPVAGDSPMGFAPPIYLDLGADGWTPPGL